MSDTQKPLTLRAARTAVHDSSEVTPTKLRAARLLMRTNAIQPWWIWLIIDVSFVSFTTYTVVTSHIGLMHLGLVAYAIAFVVDGIYHTRALKEMLLRSNRGTELEPEASLALANVLAASLGVVLFLVLTLLVLAPPVTALAVVVTYGVLMSRSYKRQSTGYWAALRVEQAAKDKSWYPAFNADEAQYDATIRDTLANE